MDLEKKDWALARGVRKPDLIRDLIPQATNQTLLTSVKQSDMVLPEAVETVEILLKSGVDLNARPDYADHTNTCGVEERWAGSDNISSIAEQTLLHVVAAKWSMRQYDRVKLLLSKGFDLMVRDGEGMTVIDVAMADEKDRDLTRCSTLLKEHVSR